MNLFELCREAGISVSEAFCECEVGAIKTDSRKIEAGDLFLCLRGLTFDGHDYVKDAVERGAIAVVIDQSYGGELPKDVFVIVVEDTRHAATMLYDAWYGHPAAKLKIVAVTGTNGKTSVTYMLRSIFEGAMHKCGLVGTVNCYSGSKKLAIRSEDPLANMTTPDPEELYRMLSVMVEDGVEYVFMEATSHALLLKKLDAIRFEAAIFTNLTPEHLDFHGDMEKYFFAKAQLFSMCKTAIINVDDRYGKRLANTVKCPVITCATRGNADFLAMCVNDCGVDGSEYVLVSRNTRFSVRTPIPGAFNVMNTLEAATCATVLGVSPSVVITSLGTLVGIAGRIERVKLGAITNFSVFIDYAHTPDALFNLLTTARNIKRSGQRVVLVFGCGGDRDKSKRSAMGKIAAELSDFCVVTSDNSRSEEPMDIICQIVSGMREGDYIIIPDRAKAIDFVIREAHEGDIILLAGKGHEEYEIDKQGKHPFSERTLAMEAAIHHHTIKENGTFL